MIVPFVSETLQNVANRKALLDCGASENFINMNTRKTLKIGRFELEKLIPVRNVDGTMNNQGSITYCGWLKVRLGKREGKMKFYLTGPEKERFMEYPFFWAFDPNVDWRKTMTMIERMTANGD